MHGLRDNAQVGRVTQLAECHPYKVEVVGSSPSSPTTLGWPSGQAPDCKSVYPGSNPGPSSMKSRRPTHCPLCGKQHVEVPLPPPRVMSKYSDDRLTLEHPEPWTPLEYKCGSYWYDRKLIVKCA